MEKILFRLFGFTAFLIVAFFIVAITNQRLDAANLADFKVLLRISIFLSSLTLIGIGLIFLRKWAAVFFSLGFLSASLWLFFGSVLYVPFPISLVNFGFAALYAIPTIATIKFWNKLSWGGRYYF